MSCCNPIRDFFTMSLTYDKIWPYMIKYDKICQEMVQYWWDIAGCDPTSDDEVHRLPLSPRLPWGGRHLQVIQQLSQIIGWLLIRQCKDYLKTLWVHGKQIFNQISCQVYFLPKLILIKNWITQAVCKRSRCEGAANQDWPGRKCGLWNTGHCHYHQ